MKKLSYNARPCKLHSNLRHIMRFLRWFGAFPVEGLNDLQPRRIRFKLKSCYIVYYIITIISRCLEFAGVIDAFFLKKNTFNINKINDIFYVVTDIIVVVLLWKLANQWPKFIKAATDIEFDLAIDTSDWTRVKTGTITYTFMVLALVEHILYVLFKFKLILTCLGYTEMDTEGFKMIMKNHYAILFNITPYTPWLIIVTEFISLQGCFLWTTSDILGMCFSVYLNSYFQELGKIIKSNKHKDWRRIRTCVSRVLVLLNLINDQLAPFILLSSLTNLFFIALQFFRSLHFLFSKPPLEEELCDGINVNHYFEYLEIPPIYLSYHLFSFLFLMAKAVLFSFMAANVNTAANKIILPLYEVPASEYNQEVEFLQMQFRFTTVGLSGIFFIVERNMILQVLGTLITYELVLFQFSYPITEAKIAYNITEEGFQTYISTKLSVK